MATLLLPELTQAQDSLITKQLIGVREEKTGLGKTRTYQYGRAAELAALEVLPVIQLHGTPRQQKKARQLQNRSTILGITTATGMFGFTSTGFFGSSQLLTRQLIGNAGFALIMPLLVIAPIQEGRARRLIRAYNDSLMTQTAYVRPTLYEPYLVLADTLAVSGKEFSYRGLPGVLPTQTPGFDWKNEQPRPGILGTVSAGLAFTGSLIMSLSALAALGPGDYRRYAWAGLGLTTTVFAINIPTLKRNQRKQREVVERYNRFVREKSPPTE